MPINSTKDKIIRLRSKDEDKQVQRSKYRKFTNEQVVSTK